MTPNEVQQKVIDSVAQAGDAVGAKIDEYGAPVAAKVDEAVTKFDREVVDKNRSKIRMGFAIALIVAGAVVVGFLLFS